MMLILAAFLSVFVAAIPHLICFTGDLVTTGRQEAEPYTSKLLKLTAKFGVASVLGNHDDYTQMQILSNDTIISNK